jgi:diguanylate cyclase (GGDEF)-like protein/PAS domain S-box-containing protein
MGSVLMTGQASHSPATETLPEEFQDRLERLVTERTADLLETIQRLHDEVGEYQSAQTLLLKREQEFRSLSDNSPDLVVRYDRDCRRIYVSPVYATIVGIPATLLLGRTPLELWPVPTMAAAEFQQMLEGVLKGGAAATAELDWECANGERICISLVAVPEYDARGQVVSVLTIGRNTTAITEAQDLLSKREQEFRALVENSPDTIARYDRECRRVYANPRLATVMGGEMARILGSTPAEMPGGASALEYMKMLHQVLACGQGRNFELRWRSGDGEQCSQVRMTPEFDRVGAVSHVLAVGRDITEIDQYRRKVHQQAFFDSLTGLPNRLQLFDQVAEVISDAAHHGRQFGLMVLDLDHFKNVNDTLGHCVGDQLLCQAANRMRICARGQDKVARLGGDEFAILLSDVCKRDDLAVIAGKILSQLAEPFLIDGRELFVTGSIGIALYPGDGAEINTLYQYADSAMYHAKKMGRSNFQFYTKEFSKRSQDRLELESALRMARKHGELVLYYQPQIDLPSGRVTGAEALLRWNRPGHGMVTPDRFIPIAEESDLMVNIGEWVLRSACATAVNWNRGREAAIKLAVNLSARQFLHNDLVGSVSAILEETGCRPEWLELEITESLLLEDSVEVITMLSALHAMGLSISLDDFGTGYSALGYLNRFPVRQIKLDRSFVNGIPEQRNKCELVKAMLSIAVALGLESVAEGVETAAQAEYLLAHGCRLAQGYLFGKPMSLSEFEVVLVQGNISPENVMTQRNLLNLRG